MAAITNFLLIAVILMATQQNTFGLNCYSCSSGTDGCGTSFSSKGAGVIQVSGTSNTYCYKGVFSSNSYSIARGGDAAVICTGTTSTVAASTSGAGSDGYTAYCCQTNLCNGSSMKSAGVLLAMAAAMLTFFFKN